MSTSQRIRSEQELSEVLGRLVQESDLNRLTGTQPMEGSLDGRLLALVKQLSTQPESQGEDALTEPDIDVMLGRVMHDLGLETDETDSHVAATADGNMKDDDMELDRLIKSVLEDLRSRPN